VTLRRGALSSARVAGVEIAPELPAAPFQPSTQLASARSRFLVVLADGAGDTVRNFEIDGATRTLLELFRLAKRPQDILSLGRGRERRSPEVRMRRLFAAGIIVRAEEPQAAMRSVVEWCLQRRPSSPFGAVRGRECSILVAGRAPCSPQVCSQRGLSGWGIDADPSMCRAARRTLQAQGLHRRVRVRCGDAARATRLLTPGERARVDVIHTASLFNALVRPKKRAVRVLRALRRAYSGRILVNVDYLGVLTHQRGAARAQRGAVLQDLAQVLSGQGIPPGAHEDWAHLYREADCDLTDVIEVRTQGLRWFIHTVQL
jgi:hypothetical protein